MCCGSLTETVTVGNGERQRDSLSPLLFILNMGKITEKIRPLNEFRFGSNNLIFYVIQMIHNLRVKLKMTLND